MFFRRFTADNRFPFLTSHIHTHHTQYTVRRSRLFDTHIDYYDNTGYAFHKINCRCRRKRERDFRFSPYPDLSCKRARARSCYPAAKPIPAPPPSGGFEEKSVRDSERGRRRRHTSFSNNNRFLSKKTTRSDPTSNTG